MRVFVQNCPIFHLNLKCKTSPKVRYDSRYVLDASSKKQLPPRAFLTCACVSRAYLCVMCASVCMRLSDLCLNLIVQASPQSSLWSCEGNVMQSAPPRRPLWIDLDTELHKQITFAVWYTLCAVSTVTHTMYKLKQKYTKEYIHSFRLLLLCRSLSLFSFFSSCRNESLYSSLELCLNQRLPKVK